MHFFRRLIANYSSPVFFPRTIEVLGKNKQNAQIVFSQMFSDEKSQGQLFIVLFF